MRARGGRHGAGWRCATLACAALFLIAAATGREAAAATEADAPASAPTPKPKKSRSSKVKKAPAAEDAKPAPKRRKLGVSPAYIVGDTNAHFINDSAPKIVPFAENSKAVEKAFAENRNEQVADAEKAARAAKSPDRWRTVLFMLHSLPDHADSEVCFWRVLSFYRLGEIERARKVREGCELPAKDSSTLNLEDARASGTPSMEDLQEAAKAAAANAAAVAAGTMSRDAGADAGLGTAPYTGPSPQRRN
jgi:hypothetical protein